MDPEDTLSTSIFEIGTEQFSLSQDIGQTIRSYSFEFQLLFFFDIQ